MKDQRDDKENFFLTVTGRVEKGYARARDSGYPTANLVLDAPLEIHEGIYCAKTMIGNEKKEIPSIVFYGIPYALPDVRKPRFEVYLLEGNYDLYGVELTVQLVSFIRENKKFPDAESLDKAIKTDIQIAREYFSML